MDPFWSQSRNTSWVSRTCTHECRCREGGPCRCKGTCRLAGPARAPQAWQLPPPTANATFADAGAGELGRFRRGGYGSPRARFGGGSRRGWASPYPPAAWRWRAPTSVRGQRARGVARAARLNSHYSRRLGWGRHAGRIAGLLGSPTAVPSSVPFLRAVARWQRGARLPITGVITPDVWASLRAHLIGDQPTPPRPDQMWPSDQMSAPPPPAMGGEPDALGPPSPGLEPPDQPDAAPAPNGMDAAPVGDAAGDMGAADSGDAGANEWGWSSRW